MNEQRDYPNLSTHYDDELKKIGHYQKYPQMLPWVGKNHPGRAVKILVFGESHYLPGGVTYHHDTTAWYDGSCAVMMSDKDRGWIKTRGTIGNGIKKKWKNKSKVIYRNIERALHASGGFDSQVGAAFGEIAFMNFFQRPAQRTKGSIKVADRDREVANTVSEQFVALLQPTMVIFVSRLSYKNALPLRASLKAKNIPCASCPHPGTRWWNTVSKSYGNKTGKNHFIDFVKEHGR